MTKSRGLVKSCKGYLPDDFVNCRECKTQRMVKDMPKTKTGFRFTCTPCKSAKLLKEYHLKKSSYSIATSETVEAINSILSRPEEIRSTSIDHIVAGVDGSIICLPRENCRGKPGFEYRTIGTLGKRGYFAYALKYGKFKYIHRIIAEAFLGKSELMVNHINGIKTDNRAENLEYTTGKQNTNHAKIFIKNKVKAYRHNTSSGRIWYSRIQVDGKDIYLGSYFTKDEAIMAYDNAEKIYFAEYFEKYVS